MFIALDQEARRRRAEDSRKNDGPFSCPLCREEVFLKRGAIITAHFAHTPGAACPAADAREMTPEHLALQKALERRLATAPGLQQVELEKVIAERRYDVFCTLADSGGRAHQVGFEIQVSEISPEEVLRRAQRDLELEVSTFWLLWAPGDSGEKRAPFGKKAGRRHELALRTSAAERALGALYGEVFLVKGPLSVTAVELGRRLSEAVFRIAWQSAVQPVPALDEAAQLVALPGSLTELLAGMPYAAPPRTRTRLLGRLQAGLEQGKKPLNVCELFWNMPAEARLARYSAGATHGIFALPQLWRTLVYVNHVLLRRRWQTEPILREIAENFACEVLPEVREALEDFQLYLRARGVLERRGKKRPRYEVLPHDPKKMLLT